MADVGLEKLVITETKDVSKGKEGNIEDNKENNANEGGTVDNGKLACAFCKKAEPTKRCSKRHPKCLKKIFCDEACENLAHKKKDDDKKKDLKEVDKKKEDAKKKKSKHKKNPEHAHCSEHRM